MLREHDQMTSNEELVERAQGRDDVAYQELHRRYNQRLLLNLRTSMPADLAEDAAQEAWIRAYERLGDLDRPSSFFPWLMTIARNVARSVLRAPEWRALNLEGHEQEAVDPQGDPYQAAELREREAAARTALESLPERQRRVLELRWIHGWSYRAIARRLGNSLSAVETLLYRARSNFHRQYESALSGVESSDDLACYKMRAHIRRLNEGQLSERRRARVLAHLSRCARCRVVHEQMGEGWDGPRSVLPLLWLPAGLRDLLSSLAARLGPATYQAAAQAPAALPITGALAVGVGGLVAAIAISGNDTAQPTTEIAGLESTEAVAPAGARDFQEERGAETAALVRETEALGSGEEPIKLQGTSPMAGVAELPQPMLGTTTALPEAEAGGSAGVVEPAQAAGPVSRLVETLVETTVELVSDTLSTVKGVVGAVLSTPVVADAVAVVEGVVELAASLLPPPR